MADAHDQMNRVTEIGKKFAQQQPQNQQKGEKTVPRVENNEQIIDRARV